MGGAGGGSGGQDGELGRLRSEGSEGGGEDGLGGAHTELGGEEVLHGGGRHALRVEGVPEQLRGRRAGRAGAWLGAGPGRAEVLPRLAPGSCQHVGLHSGNSAVRSHLRPGEDGRTDGVLVVELGEGNCCGGDEVDVVELAPVQLHPLAALLLVFPPASSSSPSGLLLVPGQLVVQVRLHPRLLPVDTQEGRVVEGIQDRLVLSSRRDQSVVLQQAGNLEAASPSLLRQGRGGRAGPVPLRLRNVGLDPGPPGGGETQGDGGGGDRRV